MSKLKAYDVALYFLFKARSLDEGDTISNLKMQKLLYYAQGYFLATMNKPLFSESIEAWKKGPVVREIYDRFKKYGDLAIDFNELENFNREIYNDEHLDILPFIFNKYNSYAAWELAQKTHNEAPFKDNYSKEISNEIPQKEMKEFFSNELKNKAKGYL